MHVGTHPSQTHGLPDRVTTDRVKKRTSHSSQTRGLPDDGSYTDSQV